MKKKLKHFKFSNCLIFALWTALKEGHYIVIRKTRDNHRWPVCRYHFLVLPPEIVKEHAVSYVPDNCNLNWPPPIFKGHIEKGD